ncbi:DUF7835 family putative zinc beta-ribbon protein [Halopenitus persicus]|uniref:DUF7835 domain-containing protein n=1 Tax=Halopenitus persicus TaxID=1048396 RepID=A0A1H3EIJ2_9EURY|nr:hypothetical protein [Halopenitus persicus]SDX78521.1 hypothetical protein SAMN05216564_101458 [Halopenitus persicus]
MANPAADPDAARERCPDCREKTPHHVRVEIRTESENPENAAFSREPYRVAVCARCGHETATRMNNV